MVSVDVKHHVYFRFLYHVLKSAGQPLPPRVYMLKKCVALPFVIKRPVLQSAGTHVS